MYLSSLPRSVSTIHQPIVSAQGRPSIYLTTPISALRRQPSPATLRTISIWLFIGWSIFRNQSGAFHIAIDQLQYHFNVLKKILYWSFLLVSLKVVRKWIFWLINDHMFSGCTIWSNFLLKVCNNSHNGRTARDRPQLCSAQMNDILLRGWDKIWPESRYNNVDCHT